MVPSPVVEKKEPEKKGYNVPALLKSLSSEKPEVREKAARELRRLAEKGQNIIIDMNSVKLLFDRVRTPYEDVDIRKNALEALAYAARHGHIPLRVVGPLLGEVIEVGAMSERFPTGLELKAFEHVENFLGLGYNVFRWSGVRAGVSWALIKHNENFRGLAFGLLWRAVMKGQDISFAEMTLKDICKGEIDYMTEKDREWAETLLVHHYLNIGDHKKADEVRLMRTTPKKKQ